MREKIGYTCRLDNHMERMGIKEVEEFANYTEQDLVQIKGFGRKCLNAVKELLAEKGLKLKTPLMQRVSENVTLEDFTDMLAEKIAARLKEKRRWWR